MMYYINIYLKRMVVIKRKASVGKDMNKGKYLHSSD